MDKLTETIQLLEKAKTLVREEQTLELRADRQIRADRLGFIISHMDSVITAANKHVEQNKREGDQRQTYSGNVVRSVY